MSSSWSWPAGLPMYDDFGRCMVERSVSSLYSYEGMVLLALHICSSNSRFPNIDFLPFSHAQALVFDMALFYFISYYVHHGFKFNTFYKIIFLECCDSIFQKKEEFRPLRCAQSDSYNILSISTEPILCSHFLTFYSAISVMVSQLMVQQRDIGRCVLQLIVCSSSQSRLLQ